VARFDATLEGAADLARADADAVVDRHFADAEAATGGARDHLGSPTVVEVANAEREQVVAPDRLERGQIGQGQSIEQAEKHNGDGVAEACVKGQRARRHSAKLARAEHEASASRDKWCEQPGDLSGRVTVVAVEEDKHIRRGGAGAGEAGGAVSTSLLPKNSRAGRPGNLARAIRAAAVDDEHFIGDVGRDLCEDAADRRRFVPSGNYDGDAHVPLLR
jgi:hypothetical protein